MIPLATTTISVYRIDPEGTLSVDNTDPWVTQETNAVFPGVLVAQHVRAVIGKQKDSADFDAERHETRVQCRCDPTDIREWDMLVNDTTLEQWRIVGVMQRPTVAGGALSHTSLTLVRVA